MAQTRSVDALRNIPLILWRLTGYDLFTFALPNTLFGVCTALTSQFWKDGNVLTSWTDIPFAILKVFVWNWLNLILFNLSNQRLPDAIEEDRINKPSRPIPAGLLSAAGAKKALLLGIPALWAIAYFTTGVHEEIIFLIGLTWMYNELGGGDEWLMRNILLAVALALYNHGSARVAIGDASLQLNQLGQHWIILSGLLMFCTIHIQDLRDVEGDEKRGRRTAMIAMGLKTARWSIALSVMLFTLATPLFLGIAGVSLLLGLFVALGSFVSWRVLMLAGRKKDQRSCEYWALWCVFCYFLPLTI